MSMLLCASETLHNSVERLSQSVNTLSFSEPITHVYNPLEYAHESHILYLNRYAHGKKKVLFLGMNPGPWGMAQTGVPFGEIQKIRNWVGVEAVVKKPENEHPKRPIEGFYCQRSEVSGRRLWSLFQDRFGKPEVFFKDHFVANYCPLVFMEASGRNFTPDKLPAAERAPLYTACNLHLRDLVSELQPDWVIGVGAFAMQRAQEALDGMHINIGKILHPSPASPAANKDWAGTATRQLIELEIWS